MTVGVSEEGLVEPQFRTAIVKVASRCNLNCSYCYMYNKGDRTFLAQPELMALETVDALCERIAEHCRQHELSTFSIGFHGGEPMLAPRSFFEAFVGRMRVALEPAVAPRFSIQTNGTLITPAWCELLARHEIRLGISLDGPPEVHDRWRVDHAGRGSFEAVRRRWQLATSHGLAPGLLSVIDPSVDPDAMYELLLDLRPSTVDFLYPQATYDDPAPDRDDPAPFASWLIAIFERWQRGEIETMRIRMFDQIIRSVWGAGGEMVGMGRGYASVVVIETDGGIEPNDLLRACKAGITRTGLNVLADPLGAAFEVDIIATDYLAQQRLCDVCERCAIKDICGGGYLPHRYRTANGFANPSVYCLDLFRTIAHIQRWTLKQLPDSLCQSVGVTPIHAPEGFDPRL